MKGSNFAIWQPGSQDGFVLGRIVDIGEDGATVEPFDRKKKPVVARYVYLPLAELLSDMVGLTLSTFGLWSGHL